MSTENKQIEEVSKVFHEFKSANEKAIAALAEGNKARHDEIIDSMKKMNDRQDALETALQRPVAESTEVVDRKSRDFASKAFRKLIRQGAQHLTPDESKALASDNLTSGGYLVPRNISSSVIELLREISPMRMLADVVSISKGDAYEQPKEGTTQFATRWRTSQRASVAESTAGTFEMDKIPVHSQEADPWVTEEMLDDNDFNLDAYVAKKVAEGFAAGEATAFISGSGVGQPLGITSTLPGTTAIESVASGVSGTLDTNSLLSLEAELPEMYAKGATFLMRRATKFIVRKLKDTNGQYLWEPSLQAGSPPAFDGTPVVEDPDVAAVAASAKAVILGDFKRAYKIIDRTGITVKPDPYTNKPHIEMWTTRRVGGQCVLPEAVKILTITA